MLDIWNDKGQPFAAKTGTTQNWSDAWTVGFSPYVTTAVWYGFDQGNRSLGTALTGAAIAGPTWAKYMKAIHKDLPGEDVSPARNGSRGRRGQRDLGAPAHRVHEEDHHRGLPRRARSRRHSTRSTSTMPPRPTSTLENLKNSLLNNPDLQGGGSVAGPPLDGGGPGSSSRGALPAAIPCSTDALTRQR